MAYLHRRSFLRNEAAMTPHDEDSLAPERIRCTLGRFDDSPPISETVAATRIAADDVHCRQKTWRELAVHGNRLSVGKKRRRADSAESTTTNRHIAPARRGRNPLDRRAFRRPAPDSRKPSPLRQSLPQRSSRPPSHWSKRAEPQRGVRADRRSRRACRHRPNAARGPAAVIRCSSAREGFRTRARPSRRSSSAASTA